MTHFRRGSRGPRRTNKTTSTSSRCCISQLRSTNHRLKTHCKSEARDEKASTLGRRSRRAALLGLLPIGIGAGVEVLARPDVVKPYKTRKEFRERASQAEDVLEEGDMALRNGSYSEALDLFSNVIELAPRNYVISMKALLGRRDAFLKLDMNKKAAADARREFAWGRGIRWPGWYIISAILIGNQFRDD